MKSQVVNEPKMEKFRGKIPKTYVFDFGTALYRTEGMQSIQTKPLFPEIRRGKSFDIAEFRANKISRVLQTICTRQGAKSMIGQIKRNVISEDTMTNTWAFVQQVPLPIPHCFHQSGKQSRFLIKVQGKYLKKRL